MRLITLLILVIISLWLSLARPPASAAGMVINSYAFAEGPVDSPDDIPGLRLWLVADNISGSNGDPVTTWPDASGNGNDATQSTTNKKPTLVTGALNGHSVVNFDGVTPQDTDGDVMPLPSSTTSGATAFTGFMVQILHFDPPLDGWRTGVALMGVGAAPGIFENDEHRAEIHHGFGSTARKAVGDLPMSFSSQYRIITIISGTNDWRYYVDNTLEYSTATNTFAAGAYPAVGGNNFIAPSGVASWAEFIFHGRIAEIILYSSKLSDTRRNAIHSYLTSKYGL